MVDTKNATKQKPAKMSRKLADTLLQSGNITQEQYDNMMKQNLIAGERGGAGAVNEQLINAGVSKRDVEALYNALDKVNASLWRGDEYVGKLDANKCKLEAKLWAMHHKSE